MQTISTLTEILSNGKNATPSPMETAVNQGQLAHLPGQPPLSSSSPKTEPLDDGRTDDDIAQFTAALSQACIALKRYGQSPAELKAMRDMFLAVLPDISAKQLTKALYLHLQRSDEIPTPCQLREIIYPPKPEWKPDWAAFVALKKCIHEGYFPLSDERQFLRDCENHAMTKKEKELENYEDAKRQIGSYVRLIEECD